MAFSDEVVRDVELMHRKFARSDLVRVREVVVEKATTGSTPRTEPERYTFTGVVTDVDAAMRQTVFGGMEEIDAILLVLPAVDIQYNDFIEVVKGSYRFTYRVTEIRPEYVDTIENQKTCRLIEIKKEPVA